MRWSSGDRSNVEDARGSSGAVSCRTARDRRLHRRRACSACTPASISFRSWRGRRRTHEQQRGHVRERRDLARRREDGRHGRCGHARRAADVDGHPGQPLRADQGRALPRSDRYRVRVCAVGHRSVLLPGRSQGLSRSGLLRRAAAPVRRAGRFRAGVRARARDRSSRAASDRHRITGASGSSRPIRAAPTRCRCASSCRPTVTPACGATLPRSRAGPPRAKSSWIRATWKRACTPPPRSATIASSVSPPATSCPTSSRTAHPSSASPGSSADSTAAIRTRAIRFR